MKRNISFLIGLCCLIAIGGLSVSGQPKAGDYSSISKAEIELLLVDVAKTNPAAVERIANDPEAKRKQIENLRQLLAFASQAQRDGLASDPLNKQELENIRAEIIAVNYDKEITNEKGEMPPFSLITDASVVAYWAEKGIAGQRTHEVEFNDFLSAKTALLKASSPEMKDREITDVERQNARDIFARIRIYKAEYDQKLKSGVLSKEFVDRANLQAKLQEAQFLARIYSEKIADKTKATDAEVAAYFAAHPEVDPARKRAEAQRILDRAKSGENFATLANEFSQDPGNIAPNGALKGGIYRDVPKGKMITAFEAAALSLQAGQVGPELVKTDNGYHIIKLERKLGKMRVSDEATYDVRHILISTDVENQEDPSGPGKPAEIFVREKLETEKEQALTAKLILDNKIQVPDDFTVPKPAAEPVRKPVTKKPPAKNR